MICRRWVELVVGRVSSPLIKGSSAKPCHRDAGQIIASAAWQSKNREIKRDAAPTAALADNPSMTELSRRSCLALLALMTAGGVRAERAAPIFVLNAMDSNVSVIDPVTWTELKRIPTGKEPHHLYLTPDEKSVIVANAVSDSLTFIDPRTAEVQRTIQNILDPYHLRFSPDMKWFVTAANRLNHVDIYRWDGTQPTLVRRIPSSKTPSHLWIDSKSTTTYVTMQDSNELVAIDLNTQAIK